MPTLIIKHLDNTIFTNKKDLFKVSQLILKEMLEIPFIGIETLFSTTEQLFEPLVYYTLTKQPILKEMLEISSIAIQVLFSTTQQLFKHPVY